MKITEGMKVIAEQWIVKPRGFRVRFQKRVDSELITDYSPDLTAALLESDVVAWRYAWKLWMATKTNSPDIGEGELINITVVDENDHPVKYYATNQLKVYNEYAD